ncbi:unnamed protein product, partial [marine sediment metagenome]
MRVIETLWFTNIKGTCGIVLGEEDVTKDPVAYISVVGGSNAQLDTEDIVAWGNKFPRDTALRI